MGKVVRDIFVGLAVLLIAALAAAISIAFGTALQAALKHATTPKIELTPTQIFLALLPTWAVGAVVFTLFVIAIWVSIELGRRHGVKPTEPDFHQAGKADLEYRMKASDESLQIALKQRDEAQVEAASAVLELTELRSKQSKPALFGRIAGVQVEHRPVGYDGMPNAGGVCYMVHLEIENSGAPSRTKDWQFVLVLEKGFDVGPLVLGRTKWAAPLPWPQIEYYSLDEVRSEYIQPGRVYHVLFHIVASVISHPVKAFEVHFKDSDDQEVICAQSAPLDMQDAPAF